MSFGCEEERLSLRLEPTPTAENLMALLPPDGELVDVLARLLARVG